MVAWVKEMNECYLDTDLQALALTLFCPFEIKFKSNYTSIQVLSKGHFNAVPSRGDSQLNL